MGNSKYEPIRQKVLKSRNQSLNLQSLQIYQLAEKYKIDLKRSFEIANLTVPEIVQKLNSNVLTSQQLLTALCYRTLKYGKQFNLITYMYFHKGLIIARQCDQQRKTTNKKNMTMKEMAEIKNEEEYENFLPPLYGIPISIKDVYDLQGLQATVGMSCRAEIKSQQSVLISCFRNSGMIPYVQTNVPQLSMTPQNGNLLWGRSLNAWNVKRAPGGSSGGEGSLINTRCSILGVGSDIGGSIRIPSDHNGVFGLKPNSRRISNSYHALIAKDFQAFIQTIPNCIGPLGKSAQDLALFMTVTTTQKFYKNQQDPYTRIVPFDSKLYLDTKASTKKLKIGYIKSLKDIEPSIATQRAVNEVLQILKNQGHQLINIQIPNEKQVIKEFLRQYLSCGGYNYMRMFKGQKPVQQMQNMFKVGLIYAPAKLYANLMGKFFMPRIYQYLYKDVAIKKPIQYQQHIGQIEILRKEWIKYWRSLQLDLVISPGFGCQAVPHHFSLKLILPTAYTFIWSVLDMASGAMPITKVREDQQHYQSKFNDVLTNDLKVVAQGSAGLPVGVQIVGLPYNEEKVLGLMSFLEEKVCFYKKYGAPPLEE